MIFGVRFCCKYDAPTGAKTGSIMNVVELEQAELEQAEFAVEVESLRRNQAFMEFLQTLSQEKAVISLDELRKELNL